MQFEKIQSKTKSAKVVDLLLKSIKEGRFEKGDSLPTERELAESMGVSRPVVREALSVLSILGIAERIPGAGTYVKKLNGLNNLKNKAHNLLAETDNPFFAWEARGKFELGIIKLATKNATKDSLSALEEILDQMSNSVEGEEYSDYHKTDHDFHVAVAESTQNPVILETVKSLTKVMEKAIWEKIKSDFHVKELNSLEVSYELHRDIYQYMAKGDEDSAYVAMKKHFEVLAPDLDE